MTQANFLKRLVDLFDGLAIPYVVVGSISSSIHGEPRFTRDIAIIIQPTASSLEQLVASLASNCYVSDTAAREAFRKRTMFNVIDYETGSKADLIIFKPGAFENEKLGRRRLAHYEGVEIYCLTPEDVILSKLCWAKISPSDRQMKDSLDVARVKWNELDFAYLNQWAPQLGVAESLEQVLHEAKKMLPDE